MRQFAAVGRTISNTKLELVGSYNSHSDDSYMDSGASVLGATAAFYDNYHSLIKASFTVTANATNTTYSVMLGVSSDLALSFDPANTSAYFVI